MVNISERLMYYIERAGLNRNSLAKKTGLHVSSVMGIFDGRSKNPSIQNLSIICRALGISIDDLLQDPQSDLVSTKAHTIMISGTLADHTPERTDPMLKQIGTAAVGYTPMQNIPEQYIRAYVVIDQDGDIATAGSVVFAVSPDHPRFQEMLGHGRKVITKIQTPQGKEGLSLKVIRLGSKGFEYISNTPKGDKNQVLEVMGLVYAIQSLESELFQ